LGKKKNIQELEVASNDGYYARMEYQSRTFYPWHQADHSQVPGELPTTIGIDLIPTVLAARHLMRAMYRLESTNTYSSITCSLIINKNL
jgi:hypothetical protein